MTTAPLLQGKGRSMSNLIPQSKYVSTACSPDPTNSNSSPEHHQHLSSLNQSLEGIHERTSSEGNIGISPLKQLLSMEKDFDRTIMMNIMIELCEKSMTHSSCPMG